MRQAVTFTAKPMLVMDIGGSSIEFILATDKSPTMWKRSGDRCYAPAGTLHSPPTR